MANDFNRNAGYLFYKKLYEGKKDKLLKICQSKENKESLDNKVIIDKILKIELKNDEKEEKIKLGNTQINMKTTYPGLLIGSGYNHDTGLEGDFKIGFFFDYTTGMPIIPGSSVKGLLRSIFPNSKDDEDRRKEKKEYINSILKKQYNFDVLLRIEKEIFEGTINNDKLPMNKRDIFYDAIIIKADKRIFEEDFLCPHGDNPLKNPTPLKFLKVLPEVEFQFRFDLKGDKKNERILTSEEKENLFKRILLDLGIGAKTNVGYGQFE